MDSNNGSGDFQQLQIDVISKQIQNPERRPRQIALQKLLDHCEGSQFNQGQAIEVFKELYLILFKCYSDRFENCRQLAASLITSLLPHLPENQYYAENIVPVLARRIGQSEIIEDSEEVRLLLVEQLLIIVRKFGPSEAVQDPLQLCYNHIMDILQKTLTDPYPAIPRKCCEIIEALAPATPMFPVRAEELVNPLIVMLGHRQSPTRIAGIRTLGTVALKINTNSDVIAKCIVSISPLLMDDQPHVRRECGRVGCRFMMDLRDRYSFFERIIPLVLCCLKDESAEIREEIEMSWRKCGEQYFDENENELSKIEMIDRKPDRYPEGVQRPTLGCRAIVQRSLRVCSIIIKEMSDWKEEVRLHSLKLLWHIVLHCERALTAKLIEIAPVLLRHCVDPIKEISEQALRVAGLLGMLLRYVDWIEHGKTELRANPNLGQLKCFTEMFRYSDPTERQGHLKEIAEILTNPTICHSIKAEYHQTLIDLLGILVNMHLEPKTIIGSVSTLAIDTTKSTPEELLYTVLTKVIALTEEGETNNFAIKLLNDLSHSKPSALHRLYLTGVLTSIDEDLDTENSERSEPILLLHGLIKLGQFQPETLPKISSSIQTVMRCGNSSAKVKILSGVSVAMLNWTKSMELPLDESTTSLRKFIGDVIEPQLTWRAGRNAEALRAMGSNVLCSMSQGAEQEASEILPELSVHFVALVDDNNVVTRAYALRCLFKCGEIALEQIKPLMLGVLARLDDPSGEVREFAIQVIPLLRLRVQKDYDQETWDGVIKHVLSTLFLHLDSPEIKLRQRVSDAIISLGKSHRNIIDALLKQMSKEFYKKSAIDDIMTSLNA